jgi:hypothetical protein
MAARSTPRPKSQLPRFLWVLPPHPGGPRGQRIAFFLYLARFFCFFLPSAPLNFRAFNSGLSRAFDDRKCASSLPLRALRRRQGTRPPMT